jgi:hypothetical protein
MCLKLIITKSPLSTSDKTQTNLYILSHPSTKKFVKEIEFNLIEATNDLLTSPLRNFSENQVLKQDSYLDLSDVHSSPIEFMFLTHYFCFDYRLNSLVYKLCTGENFNVKVVDIP